MNPWERVDFKKLVDEVNQPQFGRDDLTILGGQCAESELLKLITHWELTKMPFRVWEYSSEIIFEKDTPLKDLALLERGRIFGEGGDLMLRRNRADFSWRFIGPAGIQKPTGDYCTQDYWESNLGTMFHRGEKKALLWGEWNGGHWAENRVGAAKLNYPVTDLLKGERVQLNYKAFTHAGQLKFLWYTGLSRWRDENE